MGLSDAIVVELWCERDNLAQIAITAGFAKNDVVTNAESLIALMSAIALALPLEDRRPTALWLMDEIEKLGELPEDETAGAAHTTNGRRFEWSFWKVLGLANLSVKADTEC